jgi:hypothetical protein
MNVLEMCSISVKTGDHDLQNANLSEHVPIHTVVAQDSQQCLHAQDTVLKGTENNMNNV